MAIRNQEFYDRCESRPYPVSDEATGLDNAGKRIPGELLADLHIAFPSSLAQRAYIDSLTVTEHSVSIVIQGASSISAAAAFTPLVSLTVAQPVTPHRQYLLDSRAAGASGWVVFGKGSLDVANGAPEYRGRFTLPAQSVLLPSTAIARPNLPISDVAKLNNSVRMTGLVSLFGGTDIEVVKECREIPAHPRLSGAPVCDTNLTQARDVIVVRLKESTQLGAEQRNVFDEYRGPCGKRPESETCDDPQPIEILASVTPDCAGNIDLIFQGCAGISEITQEDVVDGQSIISSSTACGVIIDCEVGLAEACVTADRLPSADGRLPNEYDDLCESEISITLPPETPEEPEESFTVIEESESASASPDLPFCTTFPSPVAEITVNNGEFQYSNVGGTDVFTPEGTSGTTLRNVATASVTDTTFYRMAEARVQLVLGEPGDLHNAAVIANYRETASGSGLFSYFVAEIDWDGYYLGYKIFRIGRYNGTAWNTELSVPVSGLTLGHRYTISISIYPKIGDSDAAWIQAQLIGVDDPSINVTLGPLLKNNYSPETGLFGMGTNRSPARFERFCVDNTT